MENQAPNTSSGARTSRKNNKNDKNSQMKEGSSICDFSSNVAISPKKNRKKGNDFNIDNDKSNELDIKILEKNSKNTHNKLKSKNAKRKKIDDEDEQTSNLSEKNNKKIKRVKKNNNDDASSSEAEPELTVNGEKNPHKKLENHEKSKVVNRQLSKEQPANNIDVESVHISDSENEASAKKIIILNSEESLKPIQIKTEVHLENANTIFTKRKSKSNLGELIDVTDSEKDLILQNTKHKNSSIEETREFTKTIDNGLCQKNSKTNKIEAVNISDSDDESSVEKLINLNSSSDSDGEDNEVAMKRNTAINDSSKSENSSSSDDSELDDDEISSFIPRRRNPKIPIKIVQAEKIVKRTHEREEACDNRQKCPKLTEDEALKLSSMCITLDHVVPTQHEIEKHPGTRVLTEKERKEFSKYAKVRNGLFTADEDDIIVKNWKKFCKKHDWNRKIVYPFLHLKNKGFFFLKTMLERKKFVQFLARNLDDRTLYSVYHRFRNLYSPHIQGRYRPEEDDFIKEALSSVSPENAKTEMKFAALAKKLNRTRHSVWRRWILLMKKSAKPVDSD